MKLIYEENKSTKPREQCEISSSSARYTYPYFNIYLKNKVINRVIPFSGFYQLFYHKNSKVNLNVKLFESKISEILAQGLYVYNMLDDNIVLKEDYITKPPKY